MNNSLCVLFSSTKEVRDWKIGKKWKKNSNKRSVCLSVRFRAWGTWKTEVKEEFYLLADVEMGECCLCRRGQDKLVEVGLRTTFFDGACSSRRCSAAGPFRRPRRQRAPAVVVWRLQARPGPFRGQQALAFGHRRPPRSFI